MFFNIGPRTQRSYNEVVNHVILNRFVPLLPLCVIEIWYELCLQSQVKAVANPLNNLQA
jgi:hypothetical protein